MSARIAPWAVRRWSLWGIPARLLAYVVAVDLVVLAVVARVVLTSQTTGRSWWVLLLLCVVAVAFEEGATRIARLQWRLSSQLKRDMTSVWAVAAAIALAPVAAVIMVSAVILHVWWRQQRSAGQPLYRCWFTGSVDVLACLIAGLVVRTLDGRWDQLPWALAGSLAAVAAIVVYTLINRTLVTLALIGSGARGRVLIGSLDDNLTELSTLCLGGLVAIAAVHQPWLCALAILPLAMLQRGAFVRELETAAVTDPKTGLLNAAGWEHLAKRELGRAKRENNDVSVLLIDIDHFKRVNDQHGHVVGDKVLHEIAQTLGGTLREYDSVGRFGGEEFVVVLPDAGYLDAVDAAERIRVRVNTLTVASIHPCDDHSLLSVSVGVATVHAADVADADLTALLISADRALYRAKDGGRNRVCLADPDEPTVVHERATP